MKVKFFRFLTNLIGISLLTSTGVANPAYVARADSGTVTQTSYADFAQGCPALSQNTTHVSDAGGGAVELAATQADDFPGTTLDGDLWTSGKWDPLGDPYTPTITNSILVINPGDLGWVRSSETFTHAVLEASAQFTLGPSEHIGFGSDAFSGGRYLLFSTFTGDGDLYARVNNGAGEQNTDLGPIPSVMDRFRLEWTADGATPGNDLVTFYINASQVAQFSLNSSGATDYFLYLSNAGSGTLSVDEVQAAPAYPTSGIYTSCPFDAGAGRAWQTLSWDASLSMLTTLAVKTSTSPDGINWKPWSDLNNSGDPINQPDRWMEYQLTLGTSSDRETPLVTSVSRTFGDAQADLSISKSSSAGTVEARGTLQYYLSVNNQGPNTAATLTITDSLPADLINLNVTGSGWDCSASTGTQVSCALASLGVGAAPEITITVNAPAEGEVLSNTASTGSATFDPNPADNTSQTITTTVTAQADLSITKTGPAQVNAGGVLSYTLSVSNAGPSSASALVVSDTLPAGVTSPGASGTGWSCGVASGLATCTRPSLGVGSAPPITLLANAPAEAGDIHNRAAVSSATADPVANNTSSSVTTHVVGQADLSITKTGPAQVNAGGVLSYTLSVSNAGPSSASALVVSDTLPAGVTSPGASGAGWSCGVASGLATCTRPSLGVGSAPPITLLANAPAEAGDIHNRAAVSSTTPDPVANNTSSSVTTHVVGQADLSIDGSGNPVIVKINGVVTYTLTVNNAGPNLAQNVMVIYQLPAGVAFTSASGTDWVCNLSTRIVTCTLQHNLGLAAAAPLTILVHAPSIPGLYTNIFAVSSSTQETNFANNIKLISNLAERVIYLPIVRK